MSILNNYIPEKGFTPSYVYTKGFFTEPPGTYVIPAIKKKHLEMLEQIIKKHWTNKNICNIGFGIIDFSLYNWMKKNLKKEYQKEYLFSNLINLMYQENYWEAFLDLQEGDLEITKNYKEFSNIIN
jgi:hypothetical protein